MYPDQEIININLLKCILFVKVPILALLMHAICGLYKQSKLRGTQRKGRNRAVKSGQSKQCVQYKKCVQYDFRFTSEYSEWGPWVEI